MKCTTLSRLIRPRLLQFGVGRNHLKREARVLLPHRAVGSDLVPADDNVVSNLATPLDPLRDMEQQAPLCADGLPLPATEQSHRADSCQQHNARLKSFSHGSAELCRNRPNKQP